MKTNFKGEPIHGPEFLAKVERARALFVGNRVRISDDKGRCPNVVGTCVAVHVTPDRDSVNVELHNASWYGLPIDEESEDRIAGTPYLLAFKREVLLVR